MKHLFSYLFLVVVLAGCQSTATQEADNPPTQAQQLYTEAMAVHDEVMPRMEEIMQLRQKLQLRVQSLREENSVKYADSLQKIEAAVQHLQAADQAMMQWMHNVKQVPGQDGSQTEYPDEINSQSADTTKVVQVQREQKAAIVAVKEQMEASIEEAQRMIGLPE